jgi:hypothetical protein
MKFKFLIGSVIAAVAALMAVPALAYTLGSGSGGTVSSSQVQGGTQFIFTGTFTNSNGAPITFTSVTFSLQNAPAGCTATFSPVTGQTNSLGQATTTVTLSANCPGTYVLAATIAGGGTVTATVTEVAPGFPNTAAAPATTPIWALIALAIGLLLVVGSGFGMANRRHALRAG